MYKMKFWFDRDSRFGYCTKAIVAQIYISGLFTFESYITKDFGLLELVEKILWAVSFIAIGGTVAIMFFLVFAQSIMGSKTIHSQLEAILRQNRQICEQLKQIIRHLEKEKDKSEN